MKRTYQAVLLDVDGTLLYSNLAHAQAWAEAFQEAGYAVNPGQMLEMIGMGGDHILPEVTGKDAESAACKVIEERRGHLFRERYLPKIEEVRGAASAVRHLQQGGIRVLVVSSAAPEELKELLERCHLEELAESAIAPEDDTPSKPDPDLILKALERLGLPPEAVLMVGDTEYDIRAARSASVDTAAVRTGGRTPEQLREATYLYPTVVEALSDDIFASGYVDPSFHDHPNRPYELPSGGDR